MVVVGIENRIVVVDLLVVVVDRRLLAGGLDLGLWGRVVVVRADSLGVRILSGWSRTTT